MFLPRSLHPSSIAYSNYKISIPTNEEYYYNMGFDLALVESDERYHGAFVCAICQNLVDLDGLVTTGCSHCFCKNCLPLWLQRSYRCPTCNRDLLYANNTTSSSSGSNSNCNNSQCMMIGDQTVLVQPLETAQPLAHRMLRSMLVLCPLHRDSVNCNWKGDYGDLQSHLLSSTAHDVKTERTAASTASTTPASTTATAGTSADPSMKNDDESSAATMISQLSSLANSLKVQANTQFETGHYKEAQSLYTKAIEVLLSSSSSSLLKDVQAQTLLETLYSNRAATYLQTQQFPLCLQDCETILQQCGTIVTNAKVYVRASRACVQLGDLGQAVRFLGDGLEHLPNNSALKKEMQKIESLIRMETKGRGELQQEQFATAKGTYGSLLMEAPSAVPFLLGAAQADLGLGLTDSALRLTKRVLTKHPQNPVGCWIRGRAAFLMGDGPVGIQLMQEALRLDPDSQEIKSSYKLSKQVHEWMLLSQKATFSRKFDETIDLMTKCLKVFFPLPAKSTLYANLYTTRAEAHLRLKHYSEALKDCALVVYAQEDCLPAWLIRFQAHHGLGEHAIALEHVRDLLQKWPQDPRLRQAYERADFLLRKERRVDFYDLLGIPSISSEVEIRKAYKRKALELHPDKAPPDQQLVAQQRFQQLGQALEILTDDFQRKLWDEGYDPDAIRERVEAANQAAHRGHHGGGGQHHGHSHY